MYSGSCSVGWLSSVDMQNSSPSIGGDTLSLAFCISSSAASMRLAWLVCSRCGCDDLFVICGSGVANPRCAAARFPLLGGPWFPTSACACGGPVLDVVRRGELLVPCTRCRLAFGPAPSEEGSPSWGVIVCALGRLVPLAKVTFVAVGFLFPVDYVLSVGFIRSAFSCHWLLKLHCLGVSKLMSNLTWNWGLTNPVALLSTRETFRPCWGDGPR